MKKYVGCKEKKNPVEEEIKELEKMQWPENVEIYFGL